jgi:hypothetical protein
MTLREMFPAQRHLDWFNDFVDLEEVDYTDEKMRLFVQILSGRRKKVVQIPPAREHSGLRRIRDVIPK